MKPLIYTVALGYEYYELAISMVASARMAGFKGDIAAVTDVDGSIPGATMTVDAARVFPEHHRKWRMYHCSTDSDIDYFMAKVSPGMVANIWEYSHVVFVEPDCLFFQPPEEFVAEGVVTQLHESASRLDLLRRFRSSLTDDQAAAAARKPGLVPSAFSLRTVDIHVVDDWRREYLGNVDRMGCTDQEALNYAAEKYGHDVSGGSVSGPLGRPGKTVIVHYAMDKAAMAADYNGILKKITASWPARA